MKPMLAAAAPVDGIDFPHYASTKLDGIRCVIKDGVARTRRLEAVPNKYVQRMLGHEVLNGLDGELTVGPPYADDVFNRTQSGVMAFDGEPDFVFNVFDYWNGPEDTNYALRHSTLKNFLSLPPYSLHPRVQLLEQRIITNMEDLLAYKADTLELGYEGLILRNPAGLYKHGRSTANSVTAVHAVTGKPLKPWVMLKVKDFEHGEARITGTAEMLHNENELKADALGHAKRSSAKAGLVPSGVLGKLLVVDCATGEAFKIGSGFDDKQRAELWSHRDALVGHIVRYKHFEVGAKNAPRFPIFDGFRDPRDMGEPA